MDAIYLYKAVEALIDEVLEDPDNDEEPTPDQQEKRDQVADDTIPLALSEIAEAQKTDDLC